MLPPLVPPAGAPPCPTPQRPRRRPPLASARSSGKSAGIGSSSARRADGAPGRSLKRWIWGPPGRQADARVARGSIRRGRLRLQTARLDERARSGDGDKARAAVRGGRTAARRRAPRGLQFACNPLILLDRARDLFPNVSTTKAFVGRGPGRRPAPRAGRRRAAAPRGLQFACNPLILRDQARNPFPNISTTKGFVGRGGAQPPTWVVQARAPGRGGRRARG
jgi:hypothetical protein